MHAFAHHRRTSLLYLLVFIPAIIVLVGIFSMGLPILSSGMGDRAGNSVALISTSSLAKPRSLVAQENEKPGTINWKGANFEKLTRTLVDDDDDGGKAPTIADKGGPKAAQITSWTDPDAVKGYADKASYNLGDTINLKISSTVVSYSLQVNGMGWYGGNGARAYTAAAT